MVANRRFCSVSGPGTKGHNRDNAHPNVLQRERIDSKYHVHVATERYIQANRKPEAYAEETQTYHTLGGALHHLVQPAQIQGLRTEADVVPHPGLFEEKP